MFQVNGKFIFVLILLALAWIAHADPKNESSQVSKPDCELEILWAQDAAQWIDPVDRRGRPDSTGRCQSAIDAAK
jgi:hypothetical protein